LQDAKIYSIDEPYHEEQMAPPVVRQVTTPSTNSEGARVQRESPSRSSREEQPPLGPFIGDFRGNHHTQREQMALKII
jgi:hypothetical protein